MKSKSKKLVSFLLSLGCCAAATTAFVGCDKDKAETPDDAFRQAYALYTAYAESNGDTPATYEAWLAAIKGEKGDKGDKGDKGEKGDKGDTGATGAQGAQGEKGDKGDTGAAGKDGKDGQDGAPGQDGQKGEKGDKGDTGIGIDRIKIEYVYENGEQYVIYKVYYTGSEEPVEIKAPLPKKVEYAYVRQETFPVSDTFPEIILDLRYEDGTSGEAIATEDMFVVDPYNGYVKPDFTKAGEYRVCVVYNGARTQNTIQVIPADAYVQNRKSELKDYLSRMVSSLAEIAPELIAKDSENFTTYQSLIEKLENASTVAQIKTIEKECEAFELKLELEYEELQLNRAFTLLPEKIRTEISERYNQKIAELKTCNSSMEMMQKYLEIDGYLTQIYGEKVGSIEDLKKEVWGNFGAQYYIATFKYEGARIQFENIINQGYNYLKDRSNSLCDIADWKTKKEMMLASLNDFVKTQQSQGVEVDLEKYRQTAYNEISKAAAEFAPSLEQAQQERLAKAIEKINDTENVKTEAALDEAISQYYALQKELIGWDYIPSQGGSEKPGDSEEELRNERNQFLTEMNNRWTELQQKGFEVDKYRDEFTNIETLVNKASSLEELEKYRQMFGELCEKIQKEAGGSTGEVGELSQEEWNAAMSFENTSSYRYAMEYTDKDESGNAIKRYMEVTVFGDNIRVVPDEKEQAVYYQRVSDNNGGYLYYGYVSDESGNYTKTTIDQKTYESANSIIRTLPSLPFASFSYQNGWYVYSEEGNGTCIVIFNSDKTLQSVEMIEGNDRNTINFYYDKEEVVLPKV